MGKIVIKGSYKHVNSAGLAALTTEDFVKEITGGAAAYMKHCTEDEEVIEALTQGILGTYSHIVIIIPCAGEQMPAYRDYLEEAYHTHKDGRLTDGAYLRSHAKTGARLTRYLRKGQYILHYMIDYRTTPIQEQKLMEAMEETIRDLKLDEPGTAVYDKIHTIYGYISKNVVYDYNYKNYSAYHALVEKKAVCMGCAMLFLLFMRRLNVPVEYISGEAFPEEGRHAWNIVKLGRQWYNVDTTWERSGGSRRISFVERNYFLKAENEFKDHVRDACFLTEEFHRTHPMAKHSVR